MRTFLGILTTLLSTYRVLIIQKSISGFANYNSILMVDMYVLIVCDLNHTEDIATEIREIEHVQEAHTLNGVYDIIVKMSAPTPKDLEQVYSRIRHLNGVKTTSTLVGYTKL
ncbi:MAG TPA: Lrp/AsnC ligand binding domain-containing protein [Nitrososphaeraceae archaeon]